MDGGTFELVGGKLGSPEAEKPAHAGVTDIDAELVAGQLDLAQRPGWRERGTYGLAFAVAAAAHLAVLVALLPHGVDAVGEEGTALEAIAVSVVDTIPMPSVPAQAAPEAVVQDLPPEDPQPPAPEAAEAAPPEPPPKPAAPPELTLALPPEPEPDPARLSLPAAQPEPPVVRNEPEPPPREEPVVEPERKPEPQRQEALPQPPPPPPPAPAQPAVAAAEASPGQVQAYGRQVAKVLAGSPPRSRSMKGKVVVRFVIGDDGKPRSATVTASSGKPALDDIALAAVQRATFPPPPSGMTRLQLTFNAPYTFR